MTELNQKNILVLGLGRFGGGVGVTRFLIKSGAYVRVSDMQDKINLTDTLLKLKGLDIDYRLGGHNPDDLDGIDLVVVNPAIPPSHPFLQEIASRSIPITTEVNLFFERCQGKIIGVVGTNGKESVVRMIEAMLKEAGMHLFVGGNIGISLLEQLDEITNDSWVIFELSSFQLHRLKTISRRPDVAVLLNIQPDHMDWHGSFEQYLEDKLVAIDCQDSNSAAVINIDNAYFSQAVGRVAGTLIKTSLNPLNEGVFVDDNIICYKQTDHIEKISVAHMRVPGQHNIQNAVQAAAVGWYIGVPSLIIQQAITNFSGVPHALEFVLETSTGIKVYDDSAATNPDATKVGLASFSNPVWLIAGGYDKKISYTDLLSEIASSVRGVALIGQVADQWEKRLADNNPDLLVFNAARLERAVEWVSLNASGKDIILLSPGTSSYDQFKNLEERGDIFKKLIQEHLNVSR